MKHLATLLLCLALLPAVFGQKRHETSLVFRLGNYTMPNRLLAADYLKDFSVPDERIRPGYVGMFGAQQRLRLSGRWSVAGELLLGFAEYDQLDGYEPCVTCDCFFGPCGWLKDVRYTSYQAILPVHLDFQFKRNGRWAASLGAASSYTYLTLEATRQAWLGSDEPKRPRPVQEFDLDEGYFPLLDYNPRWQWLMHGGLSCRVAERTYVGLEVFWNLRPQTLDFDFGWSQTAPPPGAMKSLSVSLRNVLNR
jgi:hypothetical protein